MLKNIFNKLDCSQLIVSGIWMSLIFSVLLTALNDNYGIIIQCMTIVFTVFGILMIILGLIIKLYRRYKTKG